MIFFLGGHRESEMHNVYNLLQHQALVEGYASNYPNARLYILSRSGFAGRPAVRRGALHQRYRARLDDVRRASKRDLQLWPLRA